MSKYKEFWIQASNMIAHDDKPPIAKQLFHVIEYAAFEKLQKDWEQAATQNYADKCEIEKLKKQNEIMREALSKVIKAAEFYSSHADCKRDSWSCKCSYCKPNDHSINVSYAKKFLKDVEGVK